MRNKVCLDDILRVLYRNHFIQRSEKLTKKAFSREMLADDLIVDRSTISTKWQQWLATFYVQTILDEKRVVILNLSRIQARIDKLADDREKENNRKAELTARMMAEYKLPSKTACVCVGGERDTHTDDSNGDGGRSA